MEDPTQSAVKYVKDAWLKLVNELKDLDVILDNLNVHGVFTKEEVSVVQKEKNEYEERRTLLRKITDKGEKACYKFLKTIASMCKRNSGRLSSPTKKKPDASTEDEEFDLQKWISGFSFKSEQTENYYSQGPRSCCRYQEKLKSKALKKSKKFWMGDRSLFQETYRPDLSYTPLVLDTQGGASASKIKKLKNKKCKKSRPKKLQTYLPEDDLGISPSELLKTQRDILIVGKPGIGKTALSHEILKLWAERDSRELDYMFYFDIRETSHIRDGISLEELLFSEYCEPDEDKEKVSEDIKKYSDNVTIIFDGITDLSSSVVRKIVDGDLLPYAKVIITCRPDDEEEFLPGDFLRVEVKGFNEQTIEKYFSTMLGVDQNKIFSNVELLTLCHVPLYALMVAACFLSETPEDSSQPCSMTEIYINIVRHCLQLNSKTNKKHLNSFIKEKRAELLSLAEAAFHATERKTVSLTDLQCDDSCVLSFLKPLFVQVAPTETTTSYFFLHYTVQEFFAAVWLLKNPDQIKIVFQQCLTEEGKHMKHLIPFMCRLLTKKSPSLMEYLIPVEELNNISDWFFKEMISTFFSAQCMNDEADTEDTGLDESVLFLCQCLFESQSPEACTNFLETLDYQLDLSGEILDSYLCCAVAYVVAQSKERKIQLNLEDASVSEQGMRQLYGCLNNVHWCDPLPRQLWEMVLLSEGQLSNVDLLSLDGNQMHLPVQGKRQLFKRAVSVMKNIPKRINVCLHWDNGATTVSQSLCEALLEALPFVTSLSFSDWSDSGVKFCGSLFCAAATTERELQSGENTLELLSSVCRHQTFPFIDDDDDDDYRYTQCNFFLDLYSHIKNYETKTGSSVLQPLQSFFTSDQTVWSVDLSERKTSILLEVLKLQTEKIHVELRGWSDEESEVRNFLHCLPYISKLSFSGWSDSGVKFCGSLFCAAATTERELQSGENTLELLSSVCRHQTSPFIYHNYEYTRCDFFLDLYSHIKNYETQIGSSVLQPLQSFFISDQTEWSVDLSERKTSILLEVLKLQTEKIHVELRGWSDEESEVRNFLHCLPYISKLSCYDQEFFQCVCTSISVRSRDEAEHLVHLLQLLGFTLHLTGKLTSKTCKTVGRVLGLCGSHVDLNLTPSAMSVRGASLLFRHVKTLHSLRLSNSMALLLSGWVRRQEVPCLTVTEQLSLAPQWGPSSERVSLRVVSSLASLLRYWTIRQLDLTESSIPAQSLSSLLFHDGPLKIKLHESLSQQLLNLLCETQDDDFTSAFLRKVNGDLTPFSLNWELLHRLLQLSSQTLTVNLRKNRFLQRSITPLLPFLDRIVFKRPSPRFVLTTIREIYATRSSSVVLSFLRSFDHVISLTCREMDSDDCAALLFTLKHCDGVKLNLLWTSIPTEEIRSILCALDNVSQLSVDRNLLLKLVHCCAASGDLLTTADSLLRALQHRLDLSRSSCAELSEEGQSETLRLTVADCKAVSTVLTRSSSWDTATELHLQDCEVEDSGLDLLFSVLDRVRLRASKVILLQLVALIPLDSMRRAEYLCKALDGELDLSNTELDQGACQALACMLEFSEGLKELDLSYCQLTNQLLHTIKDHLHKVQVLDLSHNKITDASTYTLLGLISNNSSIETVRLFRNNIKHQTLLKTVKKFEIW
ncbi:uncharacterized protein LOC121520634 isoform X4 [Cheilinus undulatus]|uniref:uncharacterized protein LOC121520634 isoform X4 n=1 Tax=Cheilinus undulatus TaxID=241271 RepID=UPI001BD69985|nr:uncharacterized protein LOC121520634 isoform X4 [Cheilinus undulatus]